MPPLDALNIATLPQTSEETAAQTPLVAANSSEEKLALIAAEINAIQVEENNYLKDGATSAARAGQKPAKGVLGFIATDALALIIGLLSSALVATLAHAVFFNEVTFLLTPAVISARLTSYGLAAIGCIVWFANKGHYRIRQPFWMETNQIVKSFGFLVLLDGFFQFASKQEFSRLWLMSGWIFAGLAVIGLRALLRKILHSTGRWQIPTLLVGSGSAADEARAALRSEPELGYNVVMQIENILLLLQQSGQSWKNLCNKFNAEYVVIAMDRSGGHEMEEALALLSREGIPYSLSPPFRNLPVFGVEPQYFINHNVMLMVPTSRLELPLPRFFKRSMDILISGLGLIALSPLLLLLTIMTRRDGGPAFFGHKRLGLYGKSFTCLKFRSMAMNAEEKLRLHLETSAEARDEWSNDQKLKDDPRVTKLGAFMRRTSLDELPQLINVFKGDMSLVGPRPIVAAEAPRYNQDIAHYMRVRPGITGLWQVSGRNNVSYARRVQMDSWYVRNWSLWHDIAILFKTFPAILNRTGAY